VLDPIVFLEGMAKAMGIWIAPLFSDIWKKNQGNILRESVRVRAMSKNENGTYPILVLALTIFCGLAIGNSNDL